MKSKLRQQTLDLRNQLTPLEREEKSKLITKKLEALNEFKHAHNVLFYYAVNAEVKTQHLIEKYLTIKQLYLPVIQDECDFHPIAIKRPLKLSKGAMGVPEPEINEAEKQEASQLDLIIIPGVAFDQTGNRLGMGKGYYDRFLKKFPDALKIGLAYREQMVEKVPQDKYDVPVDLIITDQKIYHC